MHSHSNSCWCVFFFFKKKSSCSGVWLHFILIFQFLIFYKKALIYYQLEYRHDLYGYEYVRKNMSYLNMKISRKDVLSTKTLFKSNFTEILNFIKYLNIYLPVCLFTSRSLLISYQCFRCCLGVEPCRIRLVENFRFLSLQLTPDIILLTASEISSLALSGKKTGSSLLK